MSGLELTWLRPLWLLALPALGLVAWWLWRRPSGLGDWQLAADPKLFQALKALGHVETASSRKTLMALLISVVITIIALAGPAFERRDTLSFRNLDGVIFVLDASPSVTNSERWPQMLTMGRFAIASLGTRPAALIVFAGDAYVATDITSDVRQLGQTMSLVSDATVPDPGSRPERGLDLALRIFEDADLLAGDVILMSDGAGLGPASLEITAALATLGARVSVVSLPAEDEGLQTIARLGQGHFFTLDQTDALSAWLGDAARTELVRQNFPLLYWSDLGRFLLLLAILPLLAIFQKRVS